MKLASSRDLARSASDSLEVIESELTRLRTAVLELAATSQQCRKEPQLHNAKTEASNAYDFSDELVTRAISERRPSLPDPSLLEIMIRNRRKRKDYFGDRLFDDPAWDMILDLAIAKARFRRVSVTSLCIASGVPSTTALRWVSVLVECGLFRRENDDSDRRRAFISLTDAGSLKVARYFADIEQLTWAML